MRVFPTFAFCIFNFALPAWLAVVATSAAATAAVAATATAIAATATTTTTTAAVTATATAAASTTTLCAWTSFVDRQVTTIEILAVKLLYGGQGFFL